jgi:hypothetical protein
MISLNEMKYGVRSSRLILNEVYFWTDTVKHWNKLLEEDSFKNIIIDCWRNLIDRNKIRIYGTKVRIHSSQSITGTMEFSE